MSNRLLTIYKYYVVNNISWSYSFIFNSVNSKKPYAYKFTSEELYITGINFLKWQTEKLFHLKCLSFQIHFKIRYVYIVCHVLRQDGVLISTCFVEQTFHFCRFLLKGKFFIILLKFFFYNLKQDIISWIKFFSNRHMHSKGWYYEKYKAS